jgi:endonuclease/exonuclease/phosphatase (EEP) superfamily protein YafD
VTHDPSFKSSGKSTSGGKTPDSKTRKRHRDRSGAMLALLLGLGGLCAGRLGLLWIRFDVFAQFTLQFALLAAAGTVGILVPRFKGLLTACLFVGSVAAYGSWPYLAKAGPEAQLQPGEKRLRVMQFNMHGDSLDNAAAFTMIDELAPDVIALAELTGANAALLDALKAKWPNQTPCNVSAGCQMVIASRIPFVASSGQSFWEGPDYAMATLGGEFGGLRVLATHTLRFPFANAQFRQVRTLVKTIDGNGPLIVMGDFNATPFSRITKLVESGLGLQRQTALPSWPADRFMPQLAIDHIFTSPGIHALDNPVAGKAAGSDHLPIVMTLAVPSR